MRIVKFQHICLMNKMVQDLEHQVQIANALEQRSTMLEQQVRNLQTQNQGLREAMRREQDEVVPDEPQVLPNTPPKVQEEPAAGKCCTCLEALVSFLIFLEDLEFSCFENKIEFDNFSRRSS